LGLSEKECPAEELVLRIFIGGESLPAVRPKLHPRDATPCADSHGTEPHQSELDPAVAGWRSWAMRGLRTGSRRPRRWSSAFGWRWGKRWFHRRRLDHRNRTRPEPIPGHQATGLICRRDEG